MIRSKAIGPDSRLAALFASPAILALFATMPVYAQSAENEDDAWTGDIIVTAQKREQSLNDVGLSITAATADQLAAAGVNEVSDLSRIVPGLTFSPSLNNTPQLTLRGVGFNDYTLGSSPTVSVYTDQVPVPFLALTKGAGLDVERVEVLKGPQGILFGQNSTGGAINYIAAKPTETLQAGLDASYGRFDEISASAFISGAISDTLRGRIAVKTLQYGDWQRNFVNGDTRGSTDLLMGRVLLEWEPSDVTKISFNANGWRDRSDTLGTQLIGFRFQVAANNPERIRRTNITLAQPLAPAEARAYNGSKNDLSLTRDDRHFQLSLRGDFNINDSVTLTSITSYDDYRENYSFDRDGTVLEILDVESAPGSIEDFTQELRLAGDTDNLNWVVGGNLLHAKANTTTTIRVGDATNTAVFLTPTFFIPFYTAVQRADQEIDEWAAFGNLEYKVTDQITLLGGLRYTSSHRDFAGCTAGDPGDAPGTGLSPIFSAISRVPIAPGECVTLDPVTNRPGLVQSRLIEDNLSWKAGINFEPNQDTLLYASVTKGYKAGSYPVLSASGADQLKPVTQESVLAYEAGFKLSLPDRKIQLNGAGFYYDYRDKQVRGRVVVPIFRNLEGLVNIPKSKIAGGEIQLIVRPADGLSLSGSATYLDSKVKNYSALNDLGVLTDFSGSQLPFTPKWQATGDAEYRFPVNGSMEAYLGASFTHNSSTPTDIGSVFGTSLKGFTTIDLRAGVESEDGRWYAALYGRNVTNEYYWNNEFASQDVKVRYAAKPVTYGIRIGHRFQ